MNGVSGNPVTAALKGETATLGNRRPLENLASCSLVCIKILLLNPALVAFPALTPQLARCFFLGYAEAVSKDYLRQNFTTRTSLSQPPHPLTSLQFDQDSN